MKNSKQKSVRLPGHIVPERYRLMLKPDLEGFTFYGEETIYITIVKPTKEIMMHCKDIQIESVVCSNLKFENLPAGRQVENLKLTYNEKTETVTFFSSQIIPKGKWELHIVFTGILNDKMRGFYRSQYMHGNISKHMATTQFEATDARRAFPCFDEPALKAVFDVTLMIPQNTTAISNTIESSITEHQSGYRVVTFQPTPKMSTYLLAFIVGEFEWLEGKTKEGTLVRVFTTPGKKEQGRFALNCAIKTLEFYNAYFDIPYPLPVLDLIAIPDFTSGAMENWGAVTYRESALLVDPENSSTSNKQWVALVIAHELAHQWFGNLVTMHWWTDLWLNEGFASYIEYLAVNELFPTWEIWTQFAFADLGAALHLDSLKNTHPIEVQVHHPDEIGEIFDAVSYSKGASVIRMLAEFLGEKKFRDGLRYYLKKHAYGNTHTIDLWKAFEKISNKPVTKMMANWTGKPGYPLLTVVESKSLLKMSQSRFYSSQPSRKESKDTTIWSIPISVMSSASSRPVSSLMSQKSGVISKPKGQWLKLNMGQTGFYRVDYPAQMLQALQTPIKMKKLPPTDRLGIIGDAFALAESGQLPTTQVLELVSSYNGETDYTVWVEIVSGISKIKSLIENEKFISALKQFSLELLEPIVSQVGWEAQKGEHYSTPLLRSLVLFQAGTNGHNQTIEHAQKLFGQLQKGKAPIPADLRGVVYNLVAENGGEKEFNFFIKKYKTEILHEEKNRIGRALGQFKKPALLKKALNFSMSKDVRFQDMPGIATSVWSNSQGREIAWTFMKKNIKVIMERYALGGHMLSRILAPAGQFNTETKAKEISDFFKKHPAPGAARTVNQVLEKIYSNAAWLKRDSKAIGNWLNEQS